MMATDLIKTFFDTFGIEKIVPCYKCNMQNTNWDCKRICLYDDEKRKEYPKITDHILLELICILNPFCYPSGQNTQHLKESVLDWCITFKDDIGQQVQALFEEG